MSFCIIRHIHGATQKIIAVVFSLSLVEQLVQPAERLMWIGPSQLLPAFVHKSLIDGL